MKRPRLLLILLLALVAGVLAYVGGRLMPVSPERSGVLLDDLNELAWLKKELSLSPEQMSAVAKLHHEYRPRCEEMCRRIDQAEARVAEIAARSRSMTPELSAAIRESARVRSECQEAMIGHLQQTAALLDPSQAERYLAAMVPLALGTQTPASNHACH